MNRPISFVAQAVDYQPRDADLAVPEHAAAAE
jgi:hypothetical protein